MIYGPIRPPPLLYNHSFIITFLPKLTWNSPPSTGSGIVAKRAAAFPIHPNIIKTQPATKLTALLATCIVNIYEQNAIWVFFYQNKLLGIIEVLETIKIVSNVSFGKKKNNKRSVPYT